MFMHIFYSVWVFLKYRLSAYYGFVFSSSVMSQMTKIETLTGSNFKRWKEDVEIALGLMDIDLPLRNPEPPVITATSTRFEKDKAEK